MHLLKELPDTRVRYRPRQLCCLSPICRDRRLCLAWDDLLPGPITRNRHQFPQFIYHGLIFRGRRYLHMSVLLGIDALHADASAAISVIGNPVASIAEERLNRVKIFAGFPAPAIRRPCNGLARSPKISGVGIISCGACCTSLEVMRIYRIWCFTRSHCRVPTIAPTRFAGSGRTVDGTLSCSKSGRGVTIHSRQSHDVNLYSAREAMHDAQFI